MMVLQWYYCTFYVSDPFHDWSGWIPALLSVSRVSTSSLHVSFSHLFLSYHFFNGRSTTIIRTNNIHTFGLLRLCHGLFLLFLSNHTSLLHLNSVGALVSTPFKPHVYSRAATSFQNHWASFYHDLVAQHLVVYPPHGYDSRLMCHSSIQLTALSSLLCRHSFTGLSTHTGASVGL